MKSLMRWRMAVVVALVTYGTVSRAESGPVPMDLVNPFVGTARSIAGDSGTTTPGAVRPFGMLYWSPDPVPYPIFALSYQYESTYTRGFSLTHLSGTGCGVFGDIPIMPMLGVPKESPAVRGFAHTASYSHSGERAEPGYYGVRLDDGIRVRLVATKRSGIASFEFPNSDQPATLLIDLSRNLSEVTGADVSLDGAEIGGAVSGGAFCGSGNHYKLFFAMQFDRAPSESGTYDEFAVTAGSQHADGRRSGAYASFGATTREVRMKVGLSYVSIANARANLSAEIGDWDLERVRREAKAEWGAALSRIAVEGGSEEQRRVFYTALYHSLIAPSVFSDVNGQYIGFDNRVHTADGRVQYANFSGWDTYRTEVPLLAVLFPKEAADMAQSLIADAQQGGGLPIWPVANDETGAMVGDPGAIIVADTYAFGAQGFDTHAALVAMLHGADDPAVHSRLYPQRPHLADYLARGYVFRDSAMPEDQYAAGDEIGSVSTTLEYEIADFAISRFAEAMGNQREAAKLRARSGGWRSLFDPQAKHLRPRGKDGAFAGKFDPASGVGFVEGNSAQYTWMIPHDVASLVEALGGPDEVNARLDRYFSKYGETVLAPYFYISNEPCFGNPWIYNWSGQPWRTQEVVAKTLKDLFTASPGGLPGNDDLGATSSWAVFASLGIYPAIPGVGGFTFNTPTFREARLKLGTHDLVITATGGDDARYIGGVRLDGTPLKSSWVSWELLSKASRLSFDLTATREKAATLTAPPSYGPEIAVEEPK